ncbi:MAG: hypothetical protein J4F30_03835 [Acidobacteria bacterium]|nr:hypothetical protein [Acidobacteriota bacterium]
MRRLIIVATLLALPCAAAAQSVEEQIAEAVLAAPEPLRADATVIVRGDDGAPNVIRQGANEIVCEADGPAPGFAVECYHHSFQDVMDWMRRRMAEGARSFTELFIGGGPDAEVSVGAMQYALVGPTREEAELHISINLPHATGASTGLPTAERLEGPWLMWAGTSAAHVMFGEIPPGIPAEYPGK